MIFRSFADRRNTTRSTTSVPVHFAFLLICFTTTVLDLAVAYDLQDVLDCRFHTDAVPLWDNLLLAGKAAEGDAGGEAQAEAVGVDTRTADSTTTAASTTKLDPLFAILREIFQVWPFRTEEDIRSMQQRVTDFTHLYRSSSSDHWNSFQDGWCYHGYLYAVHLVCKFWKDVHSGSESIPGVEQLVLVHSGTCGRRVSSNDITQSLLYQMLYNYTDVYWGFLDFGEASRFPVGIREVLQQFPGRHRREQELGGAVVADGASPAVNSIPTTRENFYDPVRPSFVPVPDHDRFSEDTLLLSTSALDRAGTTSAATIITIGSHFGSNMEPTSMLQWLFRQQELHGAADSAPQGEATTLTQPTFHVYGTLYPYPEVVCTEFGFCRRNILLEEVISIFVANMYKPSWDLQEVTDVLEQSFVEDQAFADAVLLLCCQPLPVCSLLRTFVDTPMLVYQAFPLAGAAPEQYKPLMLAQFKEMQKNPSRSAFIAYSAFMHKQFEIQVGEPPYCIRPHAVYATAGIAPTELGPVSSLASENPLPGAPFYDPDRNAPRVFVGRLAGWAREGAQTLLVLTESVAKKEQLVENQSKKRMSFVFLGVPSLEDRGFEYIDGYPSVIGYSALRRFRAAVYFPWDLGMCFFNELYSIGVPLFAPSTQYATSIIWKMLQNTDYGWWQARKLHFAEVPGRFLAKRERLAEHSRIDSSLESAGEGKRGAAAVSATPRRTPALVITGDPCTGAGQDFADIRCHEEKVQYPEDGISWPENFFDNATIMEEKLEETYSYIAGDNNGDEKAHQDGSDFADQDAPATRFFLPNREETQIIAKRIAKKRREERRKRRDIPEQTLWWDEETPFEDIAFWWGQTDFQKWPHVTHFESVPDLVRKLGSSDFDRIAGEMHAWNAKTFQWSAKLFRHALQGLLGGDKETPEKVERNCYL
ncbi:unnamed protein product [Amoebophrya sp. A120]|nr:unnamed protein product [Amoebophrya sp. A120]|eukprot:GSA120T00003449001.1